MGYWRHADNLVDEGLNIDVWCGFSVSTGGSGEEST
jgi:hypothetical protein